MENNMKENSMKFLNRMMLIAAMVLTSSLSLSRRKPKTPTRLLQKKR